MRHQQAQAWLSSAKSTARALAFLGVGYATTACDHESSNADKQAEQRARSRQKQLDKEQRSGSLYNRNRPKEKAYNKATIYGDAELLPSRAGEHARRELALAGEVRDALRTIAPVQELNVSLSLPDSSPSLRLPLGVALPDNKDDVQKDIITSSPPRLLISATYLSNENKAQIESLARQAVQSVFGDQKVELKLLLSKAPQKSGPSIEAQAGNQENDRPPPFLLLLTLLVLGGSIGVFLDRYMDRYRYNRHYPR